MKGSLCIVSILAISAAAMAQDPAGVPVPSIPASTPSATTSAPAAPDLVEDVIRLWKANLSEGFIDKYVANAALARDLSADDVVKLRGAGVPETLITSLTAKRPGAERSPTAASAKTAANGTRRWNGLARRNSGVVMFKGRWDPGILEFRDDALRWTDAKDTGKNVVVPVAQMREQQLNCLKKPGENECFEWVVKTRSAEYRFRDVGWEQGRDETVQEVFDFFRGAYPNLIASRAPVDEK